MLGSAARGAGGGSTHPPEEVTSLEKVPSGGGLRAGQGVCAPRTDLGAIALLFVTGVTPSGCPWGPSRHHPSAGELRGRQGRGAGRKGGDCPQSAPAWTPTLQTHPAQSPQDASSANVLPVASEGESG